jgi:hypothetical protein
MNKRKTKYEITDVSLILIVRIKNKKLKKHLIYLILKNKDLLTIMNLKLLLGL